MDGYEAPQTGWSTIDPRVVSAARSFGESASFSLENLSEILSVKTRGSELLSSAVAFDGDRTLAPDRLEGASAPGGAGAREPPSARIDWYAYNQGLSRKAAKLAESPGKSLGLAYLTPRKPPKKDPLRKYIARAEIGAGLTLQEGPPSDGITEGTPIQPRVVKFARGKRH